MKKTLLPLGVILFSLVLAGCKTPAPLPDAPTPIPTLIPATLPPPSMGSSRPPNVTLPATAPDATAGLSVFAEHCASCHGEDGKGTVEGARDFSDVDYMRGAAPVDFYTLITNGAGEMPGFRDKLNDEQRWNVTWALWSFAVPANQIARGQIVYQSAGCVNCHGANGEGAIPQARRFTADFVPQHPPQQYYQAVSAGRGVMPAYQDRLSAEDRWAVVEFVRTFAYMPTNP